MTVETMDVLNERRKYKNRNLNKYSQIKKCIQNKIREAKKNWLTEQCSE